MACIRPSRRRKGADQGRDPDAGDDHAAEFLQDVQGPGGDDGTAQTEAEEFNKIYRLDVVTIPTNRPIKARRQRRPGLPHRAEKWDNILEEIKEAAEKRPARAGGNHQRGKSETLSNLLKRKYGIDHEVLNAKFHEREAHYHRPGWPAGTK